MKHLLHTSDLKKIENLLVRCRPIEQACENVKAHLSLDIHLDEDKGTLVMATIRSDKNFGRCLEIFIPLIYKPKFMETMIWGLFKAWEEAQTE